MSKKENLHLEINNKKHLPLQVTIYQNSNHHHHFEARLAASSVGNEDKVATLSDVKNLIGEEAKIKIEQEEGELLFVGIVTDIDLIRNLGQPHEVSISGYSPTIQLEDGRHCRTFEEKKVSEIVKAVLGDYTDISAKINPQYDETLGYCTQYKESNYNFIARLADRYGEWLYYDGQKLFFGDIGKGKEVNLHLGNTTGEYQVSMKLSPANFERINYDYERNETYSSHSKNANVKDLDQYGDTALKTSEKLFANTTIIPTSHHATSQKELDDWMKHKKSAYATEMIFLSGDSNNPAIQVGSTIKLTEHDDTEIGKFLITHVTHNADARGNYRNHFEAVPASIKSPPPNSRIEGPLAETQSAVVKDNADPDGLGRVRVQFHWQQNEDKTPWIRVAYPYGGNGGLYFVPEIDDEVMIGFEYDNPDRPYVLGSLYHGKNKPQYFKDDNSVKAIHTKDGNRIIMIDGDEGEIQIFNKGDKNSIILSLKNNGSISIKTEGDLRFDAKNIEMNAENLTIDIQQNISLKSGQETKLDGGATTIIKGGIVKIN